MMRLAMVALLMTACTKKNVDAPAPDAAAQTPKESAPAEVRVKSSDAPVTVVAEIGAGESRVDLVFARPGQAVTVEIWGASGLSVSTDKRVWEGDVAEPGTKSFTVKHTGAGDLAVRVEGDFGGPRRDTVKSFTVGDRMPTAVPTTPVQGEAPMKGWGATPK